jgi:hypothetical protein
VTRRLEALQWFSLLGGALAWAGQLVVGYGIGEALCSPGGNRLGIGGTVWEASLTAAAGLVALLALAAALAVVAATQETDHDGAPPDGRRRFFALAAVAGNVLFLVLVLSTGLVSLYQLPCLQS